MAKQGASSRTRRARRIDSLPPEIRPLVDALRHLEASGAAGFEGLVRDLLGTVTGTRYRLMKSGPQAGGDALRDPLAPGLRIAMEGKRYGFGTKLPLDQLKAKIHDAIEEQPDLDVWILAATREISAGDVAALRDAGDSNGVSVEVLDVPASPGAVPELAVLCAMASEVTLAHLGNLPGVADGLRWLKASPDFAARSASLLDRLTRPSLGYANARAAADRWLRNAMSDAATARAFLGGYVDILVAGAQRVVRVRLDQELDNWWTAARNQPLALLGDEGVGKTWELLSWWLARTASGSAAMPLTLFVPAGDVSTKEPEVLLAQALHRMTAIRDMDFWQRRIRAWMNNPSTATQILLLIDGLNQNPFFSQWGQLLQRLSAPPFAGRVAVAVTDRPDDWNDRLRSLVDLSPRPHTVNVGGFTDGELDQLLAGSSLTRGDFQRAVIDLLKVPRLCQLALRLRNELQDSGDITRERLVLEEWKDRLRRRAQDVRMGDEEFRAWLAAAGQRMRDDLRAGTTHSITRRELVMQLGQESGASSSDLQGAISEIVDGRWLEPIGPHRFRVRADLAPLALGFALVEHLRAVSERAPAAVIADFVDQLRGQDIAVSILRGAVTFAFVDTAVSTGVRGALLRAWLSAQNFHPDDFEALWRLTPLAVDVVCDAADSFWSTAVGGHFRDEVLTKALANAHRWPAVASLLEDRCATWLGRYRSASRTLASSAAAAIGAQESRQQRTSERRATWDEQGVSTQAETPIECRDDVDTGWLAHRTIAILSHLPRRPFARALRTWAVSRAIFGTAEEFEEIAWLLRFNPIDPAETETVLLDEAATLFALNNSVATTAAGYLLKALASPGGVALATTHGVLGQPPFARQSRRITVTNGTLDWPPAGALADSSVTPPLRRIQDLAEFATDPKVSLAAGTEALLAQAADATDVATLWRTSGVTDVDHVVDVAAPVLARWAPVALANLLRRAYDDHSSRADDTVAGLAFALRRSLLILSAEQVNTLRAIIARPHLNAGIRDTVAIALLRGQPLSRQIDILLTQGRGINIWEARRLLSRITDDDLPVLATRLGDSSAPEDIVRVLEFLVASGAQLPRGYSPLLPLLEHVSDRVRGYALMLAWEVNDPALDEAIRMKWTLNPAMTLPERKYGSLVLCRNVALTDIPQTIPRIDPQVLGHLAAEAASEEATTAFKNYVREQVGLLVRGEGPSSFPAFWADELRGTSLTIAKLVQQSPDEIFDWFAPLLTNGAHLQAHEEFPFLSICRELLTYAPDKGAILWNRLRDMTRASGLQIQVEGFEMMPFDVPESPPVSELRAAILQQATDDRQLAAIAAHACAAGTHGWLCHHIEQALTTRDVTQLARAITLAGFIDKSPEADRLWAGPLNVPPADGWLADVRSLAVADYEENARARHWFHQFLAESDRDHAHGAYLLFLASVDARGVEWAARLVGTSDQIPAAHRAHYGLCWPELRKRADTRSRTRERALFHTAIPSRLQAPWVR